MPSKTLVILAHPNIEQSNINVKMFQALATLPHVTLRHLDALYPTGKIDILKEQTLLQEHDTLVLQFPFYWYASPPSLKNWLDKVLTYNFAYGEKGTALQGKKLQIAITTGGNQESYRAGGKNNFTISELLRPFQQTAYLTKMIYQTPFVIYGVLDYLNLKKGSEEEHRLNGLIDQYQMLIIRS